MDMMKIANIQTLVDGTTILIRSWQPGDYNCWKKAVQQLSEKTLYNRFLTHSHDKVLLQTPHFINVDYQHHMALCAIDIQMSDHRGIGMARYFRDIVFPQKAEFTLAVIDAYQRRGVGKMLLEQLMHYASENGIDVFYGYVLAENKPMLALIKKLNADIIWEGSTQLRVEFSTSRDKIRFMDLLPYKKT